MAHVNEAAGGLARQTRRWTALPARALSVPPGGYFYAGDAKLEYRLIRQTAEPISAAAKRTYSERLRTLVKPPEGLRGRRGGSRRFR